MKVMKWDGKLRFLSWPNQRVISLIDTAYLDLHIIRSLYRKLNNFKVSKPSINYQQNEHFSSGLKN